ncbi:xylose isomerase [Prosthecochloris sp. GSB1]|uniref:cobamide remodeling phosphodiesterase CbiR n=1 Tax=Prosthecochloris sp. GSB1 TaxID=281093 RepID=UPI000B8CEB04|nr:cobamide remodeling phosphodiesterase CbiR [Prosthecochloris sp. GSB1]ASQ91644.1 xylose isomerase [Prosthecochloris sp. GSB1]
MRCKRQFPFRLGTTSYIIPAGIVPNIEYLCDKVDDVELVLFESDEMSNLPSPGDIERLAGIAREHDLTYSVHLPLDVYLGHDDPEVRERSVQKCLRVIELTESLAPSAYVMHAEAGERVDVNGFPDAGKRAFAEHVASSLERLFSATGVKPSECCVETLNYPLDLLGEVISSFGLSVTLDVGHLELYGFPVDEHLRRYLPLARVFHMHGIKEGRDHNGLQHMRKETLDKVVRVLRDAPDSRRVFTMEIFSEKDLRASCETMAGYLG